MATPTGPAGGDLGGTYPNPTVTGLSHVTAGGDLAGTMNAPTVVSLAHATTGPATYPAGDGSLLTNLPPRAPGDPGYIGANALTLDGGGVGHFIWPSWSQSTTGISWAQGITSTGILTVSAEASNPGDEILISSSTGAVDAGALVYLFISFQPV